MIKLNTTEAVELCSGCSGCRWYEYLEWPVTNDWSQDCLRDPKPDNLFEIQDYDIECPHKEQTNDQN